MYKCKSYRCSGLLGAAVLLEKGSEEEKREKNLKGLWPREKEKNSLPRAIGRRQSSNLTRLICQWWR